MDFTNPKKVYYALSWDIETATIVYKSLKRIQCPLTVVEYIEILLVKDKIYIDNIRESLAIIKRSLDEVMNYTDDPQKIDKFIALYQYHMNKVVEYKDKLHEYSKGLNPDHIKNTNYNI